jgi:predicted lipoprotein with Yx(FWY)xxD motif
MRTKLLVGVVALVATVLLPLAATTAAAGGSAAPDVHQATVTVADSPYGPILVVGGAGAGCLISTGSCGYPPGSTLYTATVDPPIYNELPGQTNYAANCGTTVVSTFFGPLSCTGRPTDPTAEWPALTTDKPPVSGNGVIGAMLGAIWRADLNTYQVTYNGKPLYLFEPGAGNYSGANVLESVLPLPPWQTAWFLVSPTGLPATGPATLETEAPQPGTTYSSPQLAVQVSPNLVPGGATASVYSFSVDTPTHSTCHSLCQRLMIPVYTVGTPIAGTGVNPSAIGTIIRPNGSVQVTYNGKALYIYSQEQVLTDSMGNLITNGTAGNGQGATAQGGPIGAKVTGTFSLVAP